MTQIEPTGMGGRLWSIQDVSDHLGIPVGTLYRWRKVGTGPKAIKVGRHLRYDPVEVRRWLDTLVQDG